MINTEFRSPSYYKYRAYGLNIFSEMPIPELVKSEFDNIDVTIKYGNIECSKFVNRGYLSITEETELGYICFIRDVGAVQVNSKRNIVVDPYRDAEEKGLRFLVSGIALGLLLDLRGLFTLHGSAVASGDRALAFLGPKGAGKSTTSAILHSLGYKVVTDDLIALEIRANGVYVRPGFPSLKLYPDAIERALNADRNSGFRIASDGSKRSVATPNDFSTSAVRLDRIYVLEVNQDDEDIEPDVNIATQMEACFSLIKNCYISRLIPRPSREKVYLERAALLSKRVDCYKISRPRSEAGITKLRDLISAHM